MRKSPSSGRRVYPARPTALRRSLSVPPGPRRGSQPVADNRLMFIGLGGLLLLAVIIGVVIAVNQGKARATSANEKATAATAITATTSTAVAAVDTTIISLSHTATVPQPTEVIPFIEPDVSDLQQYMLTLINRDRASAGLSEVSFDNQAAEVGYEHVKEMVSIGYFSHWNLEGYGPDVRYALSGGKDSVSENLYQFTTTSTLGFASQNDWRTLIDNTQKILMESPGHRANILTPSHTNVGIAIAYDREKGLVSLAQEFVDRYITLGEVPQSLSPGDDIKITGFLGPNAAEPILNVAYEPFPSTMSLDNLAKTASYTSAAENIDAIGLTTGSDRSIQGKVTLGVDGRKGFYHLRIWVKTSLGKVLASDIIVRVE